MSEALALRMAARPLTDADRAELRKASARYVKEADRSFPFEGAIHWRISPFAIKPFMLARHYGTDPYPAIAVAIYGQPDLGPGGIAHVRALVWRLTQIAEA